MSEEHEILADIFKDAFDRIQSSYDAGKLPHARTSILPHILTMAENILIPLLDKSKAEANYDEQLFAISATFRWTIKRLMPMETFIENMQSERMTVTDKVMDDMLSRKGGVTKKDIDESFKKAHKSTDKLPGIG